MVADGRSGSILAFKGPSKARTVDVDKRTIAVTGIVVVAAHDRDGPLAARSRVELIPAVRHGCIVAGVRVTTGRFLGASFQARRGLGIWGRCRRTAVSLALQSRPIGQLVDEKRTVTRTSEHRHDLLPGVQKPRAGRW